MRINAIFIFYFSLIFYYPLSSFAVEKPEFSVIVDKVGPSVVDIVSESETDEKKLVPDKIRPQIEGTPLMDVLRQLYGDKLDEKLSGKGRNIGSGCIISADGYIVTNGHVVENAKTVYVIMQDRRQFEAKVIGTDPGTDLALIKINANNLPFISLNENVAPKVGEWVLAIGTPFGFENSVTVGVVSAIGRNLGASDRYVPFIQTDAAVNPGNSGGPLLNAEGELLGVNSQIVSQSGDYAGLSFAIPVKIVKYVVNELRKNGSVDRGWLGIAFQDVDANLASAFGLPKMKGALVSRVFPNSPSSRAGIKEGDIITEIDGKEIIRSTDIPPIIGLLPVGTPLTVKVIRGKKEDQVKVTLEQYVSTEVDTNHDEKALVNAAMDRNRVRITVRDLEDFEKADLEGAKNGVVVVAVEGKSWAAAGILRGDRIISINNQIVEHPSDFYQILERLVHNQKLKMVPILISRQGEIQHYVVVKFDD